MERSDEKQRPLSDSRRQPNEWRSPGRVTEWIRHMKPSTKDQIKGKLHVVRGKIRETAGRVTNDPNLEASGQAENLSGKIQKKVGQIKQVFEE